MQRSLLMLFLFSAYSLHAKERNFYPWGHLALDIDYKDDFENEPTTEGTVDETFLNALDYIPHIAAGFDASVLRMFKIQTLLEFQYRYLGSDGAYYPTLNTKGEVYPQSLRQDSKRFRISLNADTSPFLKPGLSFDKRWVKTIWRGINWNAQTRTLIFPWLETYWNARHQSYLSLLIEQSLYRDDAQRSYKVDAQPRPSFRLSHVYTYEEDIQFAAAFLHRTLIYQDFWYDQKETSLNLGMKVPVYENLYLAIIVGIGAREFLHPWKRNGPCGQELGERTFDFYLHDARDCERKEFGRLLQCTWIWEYVKDLNLSSSFQVEQTQAAEKEFESLKRSFVFSLSWQTGKTVFSDPLRNFLPWAYD